MFTKSWLNLITITGVYYFHKPGASTKCVVFFIGDETMAGVSSLVFMVRRRNNCWSFFHSMHKLPGTSAIQIGKN